MRVAKFASLKVENVLRERISVIDLNCYMILAKTYSLRLYHCSTVVEHSTHNHRVEGLNRKY